MRSEGNALLRFIAKSALAAALLAIIAFFTWGFPDVTFESSDGDWDDREVRTKGRNYEVVLQHFEKYKTSCGRQNAFLVRTMEPNEYNVFAWWGYSHDVEWAVPYRPPRRTGPLPWPECAH